MKVAVFVSIALFGAIGMAAADYYGSDFGIGSISGGLGSYGHGYNYGASVVPVPVPVGGRGGLGSGGLLPCK
ncbi:hypothetical protein DPMN_145694 [Dreissena polymorpha]|uniref:Uncharacterized protein n=1 Tax=Dreissena polymorpha TaxID=45954 RepID=A0A9D4F5F2_DREPO|nr:hypothetical protein DPMN_145694 [Dreissena polymorpha]